MAAIEENVSPSGLNSEIEGDKHSVEDNPARNGVDAFGARDDHADDDVEEHHARIYSWYAHMQKSVSNCQVGLQLRG